MIKHYKGCYGEFDYDDKLWKINCGVNYIGDSYDVVIPDGCVCLEDMFNGRVFKNTLKVICKFNGKFDNNVFEISGMFNSCVFENGIDFSEFCKDANFGTEGLHGLFYNCTFKGKLTFADNFVAGVRCFYNSKFYTDFPEKISFGKYCYECLGNSYLPENFYLPNTDNVENVFTSIYEYACCCPKHFPSYVMSEKETEDIRFIIRHIDLLYIDAHEGEDDFMQEDKEFKEKYGASFYSEENNKELKKLQNLVNEQLRLAALKCVKGGTLLSDCRKEMLKLLREGKSINEIRYILASKEFNSSIVNAVYSQIETSLCEKCNKDLSKTFVIEGNSSKYTVNEMRELLLDRGYPREIVNECIVNYLENQYLCEYEV